MSSEMTTQTVSGYIMLYIWSFVFFSLGENTKLKRTSFVLFGKEFQFVLYVCMYMVCLYIFVVVCFLFQLSSWKYIKYHTYRIYIIGSFTLLFLLGIYVCGMHEYIWFIYRMHCSLVVSFTFINHCIYIYQYTYIYLYRYIVYPF